MYSAVRKYNHKLVAKLKTAQSEAKDYKEEWADLISQIESGSFCQMDSESKKRFYLKLIEMMYEQNQDLTVFINLKHQVNDNRGKMNVVSSLLNSQTRPNSPKGTHAPTFDADDSIILDSLEDKIREAEEESQSLDTELKVLTNKTTTIEKEIKRSKEDFEGRDIDNEILQCKRKLQELEDRL